MGTRRYMVLMLGATAVLLVGAAAAWACTTSAQISLGAAQGAPGQAINLTGRDFVQGGAVQVYWETARGGERELLVSTSGPGFAEPVSVPADAGNGVHYIVAEGYDGEGSAPIAVAGASFVVHGADFDAGGGAQMASTDSGGADLWSGLGAGEGTGLTGGVDPAGVPGESGGEPLVVALGLLGGGMSLLVGGGLVAARRRRVLAEATTASDIG